MSDSLRPHGYSPWNFPGQNTGVGGLSLLQGIFATQGLNPGLPALFADSLPAEPQGKPIYLVYVLYISILAISLFFRSSCKHHITGLFLLHFENLFTVVEAFGQLFYSIFFFFHPLAAFDLRILFTPHFSLHVLNLPMYLYIYRYRYI